MVTHDLVDTLLSESNESERRSRLSDYVSAASPTEVDHVAEALKEEVVRLQRADIGEALRVASLIYLLAERTGDPRHRALAQRAEAQARVIGLGEYRESLALFDQAIDLFRSIGDAEGEAQAQMTRIWALASLGRYDEALACGRWANEVLTQAGNWRAVAILNNNRAAIYGRLGRDAEALEMFEQARDAFTRLGEDGKLFLANCELNCGIVLRNLGRFDEAIAASRRCEALAEQYRQLAPLARARQNLGLVYFLMGRYNEALQLLDQAREIFRQDGRRRDAILVELFVGNCLLQLRRFHDVLEMCRRVREQFTETGVRFEVAQSWLTEAVARVGLDQTAEAESALAAAHALFAAEGNEVWMALTDLRRAALLIEDGRTDEALRLALNSADVFRRRELPAEMAQAWLTAAQAALAAGDNEQVEQLATQALAIAQERGVPLLIQQSHALLAALRQKQDEPEGALVELEAALQQLERLRGRIMVEYRAGFLEDKQTIYEDALLLSLQLERPEQALTYAERAKSRALLDLLAHRLNLSFRARSAADAPLVERLAQLRAERDRLQRRWESGEEGHLSAADVAENQLRVQQELLALEREMTDLWHRLLVRNADYAQDAAMWQVRVEPAQPYLDEDTALVEYFFARGNLHAFVITAEQVYSASPAVSPEQIVRLEQAFGLNLRAALSNPTRVAGLTAQAKGLLQRLHTALIAPIAPRLEAFRRLIIAPHGPLHYLPFHALHDGRQYLLARHEISYLPGASFLRYSRERQPAGTGAMIAAHTWGGRLPQTIEEARSLAGLWQEKPLIGPDATLDRVREGMAHCRLAHLATHGSFRPDNPLFSGLLLEDGWLTTLDVFNMRLDASLVTLSACRTGRHLVAGGDELLGLMRAFLSAGAASLLLSLWPVEDRSTAQLMEAFYRALLAGEGKGASLRQAQLQFIEGPDDALRHPYFWAPYYLVGAPGAF